MALLLLPVKHRGICPIAVACEAVACWQSNERALHELHENCRRRRRTEPGTESSRGHSLDGYDVHSGGSEKGGGFLKSGLAFQSPDGFENAVAEGMCTAVYC